MNFSLKVVSKHTRRKYRAVIAPKTSAGPVLQRINGGMLLPNGKCNDCLKGAANRFNISLKKYLPPVVCVFFSGNNWFML